MGRALGGFPKPLHPGELRQALIAGRALVWLAPAGEIMRRRCVAPIFAAVAGVSRVTAVRICTALGIVLAARAAD